MKPDSYILTAKSQQQGISSIESVIALPLLVCLLLIVLDFGRVMYVSMTTTNAARAAAGYGAQSTNFTIYINGIKNMALLEAQNLAIDDLNAESVDVNSRRFCRCVAGGFEIDTPCNTNSCTGQLAVYIEVTVSRNFQALVNFPTIPNTIEINRTATMKVQ